MTALAPPCRSRQDGEMSDTGEQGMKPQDPADQAGVGGGIVPDDAAEGYEQAAEIAARN